MHAPVCFVRSVRCSVHCRIEQRNNGKLCAHAHERWQVAVRSRQPVCQGIDAVVTKGLCGVNWSKIANENVTLCAGDERSRKTSDDWIQIGRTSTVVVVFLSHNRFVAWSNIKVHRIYFNNNTFNAYRFSDFCTKKNIHHTANKYIIFFPLNQVHLR